MVNSKASRWFLVIALLSGFAGFGYSMSKPPSEPVLMKFVRVVYEKDAGAIVVELVVPNINEIEDLSRIEMLICHTNNEAKFGVMLNRSDRCNPIPPDTIGVFVDPGSDDRSIKNVSCVGICRRDHVFPSGTLLEQTTSGVVGGNFGISIWIAPKDWEPDRYIIKTRALRRKHRPAPWQRLATFEYTGKDVEQVVQNMCLVRPIFFIRPWKRESTALDYISSVILIRYEQQPQDEGVVMKRWAGDTSDQYKYVEKEKRKLKLSDFTEGLIPLEPGIYQFNHNSVYGQPPSGFYGKSSLFEIKAGEETLDVQIPLFPAI